MANQVVQLFEALLQSIAALDEDPCGLEGLAAAARQQQEQCHKFNQLLKQFKQTRILQQRNWKKLISDHKVLTRLAQLSSSDHSQLGLQQFAAVTSVVALLVQASQQEWYPRHARSDRPPSTLANILAKQLQQSGFLQQLPVLLSTAADQLAAVQDEQEMLASTQLSNLVPSCRLEAAHAVRHILATNAAPLDTPPHGVGLAKLSRTWLRCQRISCSACKAGVVLEFGMTWH